MPIYVLKDGLNYHYFYQPGASYSRFINQKITKPKSMETKYGFTKMSIDEFEKWLPTVKIARTILRVQQHHTYNPNYTSFKGDNQFELQRAMKNYHVNKKGWADMGQHFSTFPDGSIVTGRSLETSPACIYGQNANSICMEHVGNFDKGGDTMTAEHRDTILRMTTALCKKFALSIDSNKIVYHHWYNLSTGERNNGTKNNKSCPGTNFFGGNKIEDCEAHFLPLIKKMMGTTTTTTSSSTSTSSAGSSRLIKYVCVTSDTLNVRKKPDAKSDKVTDREAATLGAILRVYREKDDWYKISESKEHWVNGKYCADVKRATVSADTLNVRSGPGTKFPKVSSLKKGEEVFIEREENGWCELTMDDKWISKEYLKF